MASVQTANPELDDAFDRPTAEAYEGVRSGYSHWQREDDFVRDYLADLHSVRQPSSLLDAPVGTGRFLPHYAGIGRVVGIDISDEMLAQARDRLATLPFAANVRLEQGDMRSLPFADREFETALVFRLFHLLPDDALNAVIAEVCRVTERAVVAHSYAAARLPVTLFRRALSRLRRLFGGRRQERLLPIGVVGRRLEVYIRKQPVVDTLFRQHGFLPTQSKTLGHYRAADVRVTIYARQAVQDGQLSPTAIQP